MYLFDQHIVVHFDVDVDRSLWKCLKHLFQEWNTVVFSLAVTFWGNKKVVTAVTIFNIPQITSALTSQLLS